MKEEIRDYTAEDIKTLNGIEHIRLRAGMYIGSIEEAGLHHIFLEILSNSIDEYLNSSCDHISVVLDDNLNEIKIQDNGRGIPHGIHESGCSILEAVFGITNTGGKYNDDGTGGYNSTGGMNGIGAKATNALSEYFIAESVRDGKYEKVVFNKGVAVEHALRESEQSDKIGVCITFKPDAEVLNVTKFNQDKIKKQMEEFSYLCKGLTLEFKNTSTNEKVVYYSQDGLLDYLSAINKNTTVISEPCYFSGEGLEFAFVFNASATYQYKLYTNNIPQLKGTHHTGFKTALTSEFNKYAKEKGLFKDSDSNLQGADLEEGQTLILSYRMVAPVYEGQNKENLTSAEARSAVQKIAADAIHQWLNDNPKEAKTIIEKALVAKRAREAAKRARAAVKGKSDTKKTALKMPSKLADAYSMNRSQCEIFVAEGNSAAGGLKDARNNEFQAILPIRGKILNTIKAPFEKILANAEISDMIDAFGLQLNPKTKKIAFSGNTLRYGKIIIAADADPDGQHIQSLFYTFVWTFCPELIQEGYIYASVPPLYKISLGGKYHYVKDDVELEEFKSRNSGKKYTIKRLKGLGEMDAQDLEDTMLNVENRVLKQITIRDVAKTDALFNQLMGDSAVARKKYLEEHSKEVEVFT